MTARSSSGGGVAGSVSLGTNYNGDLIELVLVNFTNSTVPSIPTGYTDCGSANDSTNGFAMRIVRKVSSGSESMPSLTNTTHLCYVVYQGIDATNQISNVLGQASTTANTSASYSGVVSYPDPGVDWVGTVYIGKNSAGVPTAPTSMSAVVNDTSGGYIQVWDSNAALSSYSFNSKAISASSAWITKTYVIRAGSSGGPGAGTPTNLFFGAVRP